MTILEAHVPHEKWAALEEAYKAGTEQLDPRITQAFLIHGSMDSTLWRILTVWRSRKRLAVC